MDNVCNRRLFSFPAKVEMAEEQEYLKYFIFYSRRRASRRTINLPSFNGLRSKLAKIALFTCLI